jgi:hypothetical protein
MPAKHPSGPFYLKKPAADRLAELLGVPVSPRSLEGWDIPYTVVNGRMRYAEETLSAAAAARLAAAPRRTGRVKRHPVAIVEAATSV